MIAQGSAGAMEPRGKFHDDAFSLVREANRMCQQGRGAEAEKHYRRALGELEEVFGPDHLEVAGCLNNMGVCMRDLGRQIEAQHMHRRALRIRQALLGREHPDVAMSLNNLASCLYDLGDLQEAQPMLRRALDIAVKTLGEDHPLTLNVRANLR